jgi:spore coat protein U-like protein
MKQKYIAILTYMACVGATTLSCTIPVTAYAGSSSANTQTTATLSATCVINAQNLNFGNITLPLSAQSASTSMSVLCNNKASYTVALAYGGVYGAQPNNVAYYQTAGSQVVNGKLTTTINAYSSTGTILSSFVLPYPGCACTGGFASEIASYTGNSIDNENTKYINNNYSTGYSYGKMIGVASGDQIGYSIQVPGNPGTVWNTGSGSYTATGSGVTQSIPVTGVLVPAQSGAYPTPDYYMDTVTATVNF